MCVEMHIQLKEMQHGKLVFAHGWASDLYVQFLMCMHKSALDWEQCIQDSTSSKDMFMISRELAVVCSKYVYSMYSFLFYAALSTIVSAK